MVLHGIDYSYWPFVPGTILYHGSRGGIDGPIVPWSRPRTDFGRGFCMGSDSLQTKALVLGPQPAYSYALSVDFQAFPDFHVLELNDLDWMYTILHNRKSVAPFVGSALDREIGRITDGADFIIGPIADDKMSLAVSHFEDNVMTDEGLIECLRYVPYGYQVVAKSQRACDAIEVLTESPITSEEYEGIDRYSRTMRAKAADVVRDVAVRYAAKGRSLDALLASQEELDRLRAIPSGGEVIRFYPEVDPACRAGRHL